MRTMALRDFQQRGASSLPPGDPADPLLLSGRHGQFFLVPVLGADVGRQYEALRAFFVQVPEARDWVSEGTAEPE